MPSLLICFGAQFSHAVGQGMPWVLLPGGGAAGGTSLSQWSTPGSFVSAQVLPPGPVFLGFWCSVHSDDAHLLRISNIRAWTIVHVAHRIIQATLGFQTRAHRPCPGVLRSRSCRAPFRTTRGLAGHCCTSARSPDPRAPLITVRLSAAAQGIDRLLSLRSFSPLGASFRPRLPPRPRAQCASGRSLVTAPTKPRAATPRSATPHLGRHSCRVWMESPGPRKGCCNRRNLQALSELRDHASDILPSSATPPP
ncbi:hypothetical protein NDU88_004973 [Pleurodeles waltl]|uniref:Secreted protein n=1 Tax=Pleurodeles waltl TaxID=8319 RepID=A0AAV7RH63_PLEWA|nr:hypothetical protein NDU88_004973 [Pleurodeles waltl]